MIPPPTTLLYALWVSKTLKVCSFCGRAESAEAQMFCPESEGPQNVAICEDCVLTCAKAIDVEKRLSERPSGPNDEASDDTDLPLGNLVQWSPFELAGVRLEWRADRRALHSAKPMYHVTLRRDGEVEATHQLHEIEPSPASISLALKTEHLAEKSSPTQAVPVPGPEPVHGWSSLEEHPDVEWNCQRVWVAKAGLEVSVKVRRAGDPMSTVQESFSSRIEPTVDDAETVAEDHWERLGQAQARP